MGRLLLKFVVAAACVVSLLASLAVAGLWWRSYRITDVIRGSDGAVWQSWICASGRVLYLRAWRPPGRTTPIGPDEYFHNTEPPTDDVATPQWLVRDFAGVAGFAFGRGSAADYDGRAMIVPLWFVCLLLATPSGLWVRARRRRRIAALRSRTGFCARCGYDLRATPGRCPECGTNAPALRAIP